MRMVPVGLDEGKGNPVGLQFLGRAGPPKSQGLGSLGAMESVWKVGHVKSLGNGHVIENDMLSWDLMLFNFFEFFIWAPEVGNKHH